MEFPKGIATNHRKVYIRMNLWILTIIVFCCVVNSFAAEPYFAPISNSGSMVVKLYPTENVASGQSTLVTFGALFPWVCIVGRPI